MTYKPTDHPDYDALRAVARKLTSAMIQQRARDSLRHAVSAEMLEGQGISPMKPSGYYYDESSFYQTYLQHRLNGLTDDEIQQASEASNRA